MDSHQTGGNTHPDGQSNQSATTQKINNIMHKYDGILSDTDKSDLLVLSKQLGSSELLQTVNEATGRDYKTFEDFVSTVGELTKHVQANKKIKEYFDGNPQLRTHISEDGEVTVGEAVQATETEVQVNQTADTTQDPVQNAQHAQSTQNVQPAISDPELEAFKAKQREEFWNDPKMASIKDDLLKESAVSGQPFMAIYNEKKAVYDELAEHRVQKQTQNGEADTNSIKEEDQQDDSDFYVGLNN